MKLKGISLFDDLGKIKNKDGKMIKPFSVYRSSHLSKMSEKTEQKLISKYHVAHVCDFRTDEELERFPELEHSSIKHYFLPALDKEQNTIITKETRMPVLKKITYEEGGAIIHMHHLYHNIYTSPMAWKAYRSFFDVLLEAKDGEAVVFHCTQGKDRTGVALLLFLSALDVDEKTIEKSYMKYNRMTRAFRFWVRVGMNLFVSPRLGLNLDRIISARRVYIQKTIQTIKDEYGGMKNYLNNIIGISDEEIKQLKLKYLM